MISKHIGFRDSEVMRELERQELKKAAMPEKGEKIAFLGFKQIPSNLRSILETFERMLGIKAVPISLGPEGKEKVEQYVQEGYNIDKQHSKVYDDVEELLQEYPLLAFGLPDEEDEEEDDYGPTENVADDVMTLARGLRNKGFTKEATDLEDKFLLYKTAETHLYRVFDEDGEDLIDFSHQDGDIEVAPAKEGYGKVETIVSQHKKIEDVVNKKPTGKLGGHPAGAKKSGEVKKTAREYTGPQPDVPKPTVKLPSSSEINSQEQLKQEWNFLYNTQKRLLNLIIGDEDAGGRGDWGIKFGSGKRTRARGSVNEFWVEAEAPGLFTPNNVVTLFTETYDRAYIPERIKNTPYEGLLKFYLKKSGQEVSFNKLYDGVFEKLQVKASPGSFYVIFNESQIAAINKGLITHVNNVVKDIKSIDYGSVPNLGNREEMQASVSTLETALATLQNIMQSGMDRQVQTLILSKLDDNTGNRIDQYKYEQDNPNTANRIVHAYNDLQTNVRRLSDHIENLLKKPTVQVAVGPAEVDMPMAKTVGNVWTTPSTKLALVGSSMPNNRGQWLAKQFEQLAVLASNSKKWKQGAPIFKQAAVFCRQYVNQNPKHTLWNLLVNLSKNPSFKSYFSGWEVKIKNLEQLRNIFTNVLPAKIKSASVKSVVKTAGIEDPDFVPPGATPTPKKPTAKPGNRLVPKNRQKAQYARYQAAIDKYHDAHPEAADAVIIMQNQLNMIASKLGEIAKQTNKITQEEVASAVIKLLSTGLKGGRSAQDSLDGLWATSTNTALEALQNIIDKLYPDDNIKLNNNINYKSAKDADIVQAAQSNSSIIEDIIKKKFKEDFDVTVPNTPDELKEESTTNQPTNQIRQGVWDQLNYARMRAGGAWTDISENPDVFVRDDTFNTLDKFANFLESYRLASRKMTGELWDKWLGWFAMRANWLRDHNQDTSKGKYLTAVQTLRSKLRKAISKLGDKAANNAFSPEDLKHALEAATKPPGITPPAQRSDMALPLQEGTEFVNNVPDFPISSGSISLRRPFNFPRTNGTQLGRQLLQYNGVNKSTLYLNDVNEFVISQLGGHNTNQPHLVIQVLQNLKQDINNIKNNWSDLAEQQMTRPQREARVAPASTWIYNLNALIQTITHM